VKGKQDLPRISIKKLIKKPPKGLSMKNRSSFLISGIGKKAIFYLAKR
jgi:hypothetical protein